MCGPGLLALSNLFDSLNLISFPMVALGEVLKTIALFGL